MEDSNDSQALSGCEDESDIFLDEKFCPLDSNTPLTTISNMSWLCSQFSKASVSVQAAPQIFRLMLHIIETCMII